MCREVCLRVFSELAEEELLESRQYFTQKVMW